MAPSNSGAAFSSVHARNRKSQPRIIPAIPLSYIRVAIRQKPPTDTVTAPSSHPLDRESTEAPIVHPEIERPNEEEEKSLDTTLELISTDGGQSSQETGPDAGLKNLPEPEPEPEPAQLNGSIGADKAQEVEEKQVTPTEPVKAATSVAPGARMPSALPPPFYPSEVHQTSVSTSSVLPPPGFHMDPVAQDFARPNALAFGGTSNSSNTSPAPNSATMPPYALPPTEPHAYLPHGYPAPTFFPAHTHHVSDPYNGSLYSVAPPAQFIHRRDDLPNGNSWIPPESTMPFDIKQQHMYSATIRSHDHPHHAMPNDTHYPPRGTWDPSTHELGLWIRSQFQRANFADGKLCVWQSNGSVPFEYPLHSIITGRSPALRYNHASSASPEDRVVVLTPTIMDPEMFEAALFYLYGGDLVYESAAPTLPPFDPHNFNPRVAVDARSWFTKSIAYMAAGHTLGVPRISKAGKKLVFAALRWDTVETAIGIMGTLRKVQGMSEDTNTLIEAPPATSDGSFAIPDARLLPEELAQMIVDFLAHMLPSGFTLDESAQQLEHAPRLPAAGEPRTMTHRPRLSQIRFGDAPTAPTSFIATLLSSILLSLTHPVLYRFFEHADVRRRLSPAQFRELLTAVVSEREERRVRALRQGSQEDPLWRNVLWEESIQREPDSDQPQNVYLSRKLHPNDYKFSGAGTGDRPDA